MSPKKLAQGFHNVKSDKSEKVFVGWIFPQGQRIKTASLEEDPVFGKPLADALRATASPLLKMLLDLFDGNADEALYMVTMAASFACSWANRCEFVYMTGAGNSGKDTFHNLMGKFFGSYGTVLPQK